MGKYVAGPSVLQFGNGAPIQSGETFEHDFSTDGPEGEHGPDREAALIASGAMTPVGQTAPAATPPKPVAPAPAPATVKGE